MSICKAYALIVRASRVSLAFSVCLVCISSGSYRLERGAYPPDANAVRMFTEKYTITSADENFRKKMAKMAESNDFRPFKFRIQAFTNAFMDVVRS